jgi:hypothetical protein
MIRKLLNSSFRYWHSLREACGLLSSRAADGERGTGLKRLIFALSIIAFVFVACKKDDMPENPYDDVDYSDPAPQPADPDPNSIAGLHKNIFFPRCANPGCHDGTFEPDFRTVESSYATLVYQPVNKVTLDSAKLFSLRVIPHNVSDSWIIERLTTSTSEYMPSNGVRLSAADIDHVKNWINAGCPDNQGNEAVKPNLQPNVIGYVAVDSAFARLDTVRVGNYPLNPFIVKTAIDTMLIAFVAVDSADGSDGTDPSMFTVKEIRFSTDKNNFNGALTLSAYLYLQQFNSWLVIVPKSYWAPGTTVYFRVYVNDGDHATDAEFPRYESMDYYKTLYAFYVE